MNTGIDKYDTGSREKLRVVHPDLRRVIERVADFTETQFRITEGTRSTLEQARLFAAGATHCDGIHKRSKHQDGRAVDVALFVDGRYRQDWPLYDHFAREVVGAANLEGVAIVWGGDWPTLRDGPHFELAGD